MSEVEASKTLSEKFDDYLASFPAKIETDIQEEILEVIAIWLDYVEDLNINEFIHLIHYSVVSSTLEIVSHSEEQRAKYSDEGADVPFVQTYKDDAALCYYEQIMNATTLWVRKDKIEPLFTIFHNDFKSSFFSNPAVFIFFLDQVDMREKTRLHKSFIDLKQRNLSEKDFIDFQLYELIRRTVVTCRKIYRLNHRASSKFYAIANLIF